MRDQVLHYIRERELLRAGDRVAVAVSGGADSVALLRILLELRAELGIVLGVAHFNHQLRSEASDADERFVAELARQHDLPNFAGRADVCSHALATKVGIEHAARELRYQWLLDLAREQYFDAIATAHTSDDQAETVLMKFLRGSGTRGLAGIHPVLRHRRINIVRPLLETGHSDIEQHLNSIGQPWREDETNSDLGPTRNRIRHELLPLLERDYNPNLRDLLSETADVARDEEAAWQDLAAECVSRWLKDERHIFLGNPKSCFSYGFLAESIALQRRTLRYFLERNGIATDFHHVESVRQCALGDTSSANLPDGWKAERQGGWLELLPPSAIATELRPTYLYSMPLPGRCSIPEVGIVVQATLISAEAAALEPPGFLLQASALCPNLLIRNWQPGDRFRPAHTASEEKLKRLFSEKRIPAAQRPLWPLALCNSQIVWVQGFPVAHDFVWLPGSGDALKIEVLDVS